MRRHATELHAASRLDPIRESRSNRNPVMRVGAFSEVQSEKAALGQSYRRRVAVRFPDKAKIPKAPCQRLNWQMFRGHYPALAKANWVGVPKGHPWHGLDYTASPELDAVEVHGGLTFASRCQHPEDEATGVCHVVEDGDDDDVWWLGFDCAHYGDCSPGYQMFDGSYKTAEYIRFECANLARQVIEADA